MIKLKILLIAVLLSSCTPRVPYEAKEMPIKWCVDKCIDNKFSAFSSSQLFSGSSSMGGMIQTDIFKEVVNYCQAYYDDKCYENYKISVHGFASDTEDLK